MSHRKRDVRRRLASPGRPVTRQPHAARPSWTDIEVVLAATTRAVRAVTEPHGPGRCLPTSTIAARVLRHHGIPAEVVPCSIRLTSNAPAGEDVASMPLPGLPGGHAVVIIRGADKDVIVDLTTGQFQDSELGIHTAPVAIWPIPPGSADLPAVGIVVPSWWGRGVDRIVYGLQPDVDITGLVGVDDEVISDLTGAAILRASRPDMVWIS